MLKALFICLALTQSLMSFSWAGQASDVVITPVRTATCTEGDRIKNIHVTKMLSAKKVQEDDQSLTLEFELSYYTCSDLAVQPLDFITELAYVDVRAAPKMSQKSLSRFNFVYPSIKVISVQAEINKTLAFEKQSVPRYGLALYPFGDVKSPHDFGGYSSTWIIDLYKDGKTTKVHLSPLNK